MGWGGCKIAVFINRSGKPCILCSRNREAEYPKFCINCTRSHCPAGTEQAVNAPGRVNSMHRSPRCWAYQSLQRDGAPCALRILAPQAIMCLEQRAGVMRGLISLPRRCRASVCTSPTLCQCIPPLSCNSLESCACSIKTGKIASYICIQQIQQIEL